MFVHKNVHEPKKLDPLRNDKIAVHMLGETTILKYLNILKGNKLIITASLHYSVPFHLSCRQNVRTNSESTMEFCLLQLRMTVNKMYQIYHI